MDNCQNQPAFEQGAPMQQTIIVETEKKGNSMGTAGFVLAILAIVFSWVPVLDFILWFLGALFSFIGIFRKPKGLAIAGLVISFIGIIILVAFIGTIGAMMSF